jgi:bile-acid 7alpha-dehydratase
MSQPDLLAELHAAVQRLTDARAIEALKYRYFRAIDTGDFDLMRSLLHDDLETDLKGGTYHVATKGADAFIAVLRQMLHPQVVALHQGHHPEIEVHTPNQASGRWYLWDDFRDLAAGTRFYGSAIYEDEYLKVGDRWRLRRTSYRRVFEVYETNAERPNLTVHLMAGCDTAPAT